MNDYINKKAAYKVLTLYTASFVCLFILYRKSSTDQDNNQQSQNCIQFGEYGHHHSSTEHIVAGSNACDTICSNLCLTDRREQTCKTQHQACTEDSGRIQHCDAIN